MIAREIGEMRKKGITVVSPQEGFQQRFTRSNCNTVFGGGVLNPQPLTSSILTPSGFVKFADIKVGDEVIGLQNERQYITHRDNEGEKDCIRVVLEDGSSAESALDHKWWILRDGIGEMTAISFELLESYQISVEKGLDYGVSVFRYIDGKPVPVKVKEIIDIGKQEVVCIGVSNDDELYITDDYLITKNCGKAQPYDARILTPDGFVRMGELVEGDIITSTEGGTQTVLRIYEKGIREIFTVHFKDGRTQCCAEHLWKVYDKQRQEFCVLTTQEIMDMGCDRFAVACPKAVEFTPYAYDERLHVPFYVLGRILGKGDITSKDISPGMRERLSMAGVKTFLGIPLRYKRGSIQERKDLLRGFIDEVASPFEPGTNPTIASVVSGRVSHDLSYVVHSLGGTTIRKKCGNDRYRIWITMPNVDEVYSPNMNDSDCEERVVYRDLMKIVPGGKKKTRCILVSDACHLYITDFFIPTHNTFAAILMVAEPSLDPRFRAAFTRRNLGNLKQGGGIVDDFQIAYGDMIKVTTSENPRITFPSGSYVDCLHIADETPSKLMERAKGWQYDVFYMDELTSYAFTTFSIVGTRARGKSNFTGHVFGTTNPKRSHWTRDMLDWYIGIDGFIIPERDGVVRYYFQNGETVKDIIMGDTPEEVYALCKPNIDRKLAKLGGSNWTYKDIIRSFVFYAGKMSENKASVGNNPSYIGAVAAVGGKRSEQLIEGNFNVDEDEEDDIPIPSRAAMSMFCNDECRNGIKWITVDLADVGTDNMICLLWDGFHIEDILIIQKGYPRENWQKLNRFAVKNSVPDSHIIYDGTHGAYMHDYMPDAKAFVSSSSAIGLDARTCDRLKDEAYYRLVDMIKGGRISCSLKVAKTIYKHQKLKAEITVQAELLDECKVVRFKETTRGMKKLLPKKEMNAMLGNGRSMDVLDPIAYRMLTILDVPYGEELDAGRADREDEMYREEEGFDIYNDGNWA